MTFENSLQFARELDNKDPLRHFRIEFLIPSHEDRNAIYFLGNSLGLQPKRTSEYIQQVLKQWSNYGVEGFFIGEQPWMNYHRQLLPTLSEMVGALPDELVVMNQLSVNLHLMLISFYQPQGKRDKILCEAKAFPSDQYIVNTHVRQRGLNPDNVIIEVEPRTNEVLIKEEDILAAIQKHKDELALVLIGGINYYTGQVFNMEAITKAAHAVGAKAGFDLAHAAGNIALQLHNWNVDFACWCSYKYLNSGPGAVAGNFIHERYHNDPSLNRFAGWWGNKKETQFLMKKDFAPELSAEGWQLSTPSAVLFAAHQASLDLFKEAGIKNVFDKNKQLSNYLWFVLAKIKMEVPDKVMHVFTPTNADERGCQVSLSIKNGKKVFDTLSQNGVYADWREPDVIRIAPVGLYNTFEEVWQFGQLLKSAINKHSA
ncbi:MAG TPA: kynureninase [Flavisolibacter sp.]|nr:kynureninase [Flavisolibacter sp.]